MVFSAGNLWRVSRDSYRADCAPADCPPSQSKSKFLNVAQGGFGFCSVILCDSFLVLPLPLSLTFDLTSGWDIHDTVYPNELLISNKQNGYRDLLASIDLATYRRIPWEDNVPFFLVSFLDPETKEAIPVCPRGTLNKATTKAAEKGWQCVSGVEYEVRVRSYVWEQVD